MKSFAVNSGQTYVFIGDSITDCSRRGGEAPFGNGYARMTIDLIRARYPERRIRFINEGIGGNTVQDLHNRWHDDLLRHKPDWVSIMIGINDLHRVLRGDATAMPPELYEQLYRDILRQTRTHTKARLVLIDPFYISTDTRGQNFRAKVLQLIPKYIRIVHKLAGEFDTRLVRTHDIFQQQLRHALPDTFCPEPVHPNPSGHLVIAHALLRELGW